MVQMQTRFGGLTDLSARFERTFQWSLTGKRQTFKGKLVLKKPDKFRFEADGQVVSTDGRTVWNYTEANRQVVVSQYAPPEKDRTPEGLLFHLLFLGAHAQDYAARDSGTVRLEGKPCRLIGLTARKEGGYVTGIRLWIDSRTGFPQRVQYTDYNADLTTYRLWAFKVNPRVTDSAFRFIPPPGTDVVDLR